MWHLNKIRRDPEIFMKFEITGAEMKVGTPWGGLLYIMVSMRGKTSTINHTIQLKLKCNQFQLPRNSKIGVIKVTFANVVEAPYFVLGLYI